jgi:hypothetical protein
MMVECRGRKPSNLNIPFTEIRVPSKALAVRSFVLHLLLHGNDRLVYQASSHCAGGASQMILRSPGLARSAGEVSDIDTFTVDI